MEITLQSTVDFLKSRDRYSIFLHASPDGDTIGAGVALLRTLRKMGKRAYLACSDPIPARYNYLFEELPEPFGGFQPETIVAVDIADEKLLGDALECYESDIDLCIDHHASNTLYARRTYLDVKAAATCEIIGNLIKALGQEPDRHIADGIFTGLATDTGCFRYTNTTPAAHRMAADMIEAGADAGQINRLMFDTKSRLRIEIERAALQNIEFHFDNRCALICITKEMYELIGTDESELDGITSLPRQIEGVLVGVTIRQRGDKCKISIRTRVPYDASAMCRMLGGGGHVCAAGCELSGSLDEVKRQILAVVEEFLTHGNQEQPGEAAL